MFLFPSIIYVRMDPYEKKRVCGQNNLISSGKEYIINNSKHYANSFNEMLSQMEGFPIAANLS